MITDDDVDEALNFLKTNSEKAAKAKAHKVYTEEYRKSIKAEEMAKFSGIPVSAQEREAYRSPIYKQHLKAIEEAVYDDELARWKMIHATTLIEAWRTQNANRRGEGKLQ